MALTHFFFYKLYQNNIFYLIIKFKRLPDDEITRTYKDRVKYVKKNYNGLLIGNESNYTSCPKIIYHHGNDTSDSSSSDSIQFQ